MPCAIPAHTLDEVPEEAEEPGAHPEELVHPPDDGLTDRETEYRRARDRAEIAAVNWGWDLPHSQKTFGQTVGQTGLGSYYGT